MNPLSQRPTDKIEAPRDGLQNCNITPLLPNSKIQTHDLLPERHFTYLTYLLHLKSSHEIMDPKCPTHKLLPLPRECHLLFIVPPFGFHGHHSLSNKNSTPPNRRKSDQFCQLKSLSPSENHPSRAHNSPVWASLRSEDNCSSRK